MDHRDALDRSVQNLADGKVPATEICRAATAKPDRLENLRREASKNLRFGDAEILLRQDLDDIQFRFALQVLRGIYEGDRRFRSRSEALLWDLWGRNKENTARGMPLVHRLLDFELKDSRQDELYEYMTTSTAFKDFLEWLRKIVGTPDEVFDRSFRANPPPGA